MRPVFPRGRGNPRLGRAGSASAFQGTQRWLAALLITGLLLGMITGAMAAEELRADITGLGYRARNDAPIPVEVRFDWNATRILEGRLDLEFHEGNRVLGRFRSGELALGGGVQKFHMLLPPIKAPSSDSQVEVQMQFVTTDKTLELLPSSIAVPTVAERALLIGWCDALWGASSAGLGRNLLLEKLAPSPNDNSPGLPVTGVVRLGPEELPAQPVAYTSYDLMVLTAEAFQSASERQLQALARWVRGGGSVCVFVSGGVQAQQLWFLNSLAESGSGVPTFVADSTGNLLPAKKETLCLRSGLGRGVIVTGSTPLDVDLSAAEWRHAVAFLWKLRSSQIKAVTEDGHWSNYALATENNPVSNPMPRPQRYGFPRLQSTFVQPTSFAVQTTELGAELMNFLMPRTIRLIPFSSLMGLLVLFLLLIGPGDYFGLGFFRRRRLTWVVFPATSVAFTIATVLMANHYLGLRDQRRSLVVVDLDHDGTALRWNRYELVFAARDKQAVTELKDALWAPLDVRAIPDGVYGSYNPYNRSYGYSEVDAGREAAPPLYEGALPVHFRTRENLRQWRPEVNRTFSFEPPPVPLFPNWPAVEAAWPDLRAVRAKLAEKSAFSGDVYAISSPDAIKTGAGSPGIFPTSILNHLCSGDAPGFQALVSQVSPTGGGNFEDAPAMDSEAADSVLVIVTQSGDDTVVYRSFFHGK